MVLDTFISSFLVVPRHILFTQNGRVCGKVVGARDFGQLCMINMIVCD